MPRTGWFAPSACRVPRGGAYLERVQDRPDLHIRPAPRRDSTHAPLIELGRTRVVAPGTGAHDLLNCRANIAGKPPGIGLQAATPGMSWARMPFAHAETEYRIVCGLRLAQSPPFRLLIARARQHSFVALDEKRRRPEDDDSCSSSDCILSCLTVLCPSGWVARADIRCASSASCRQL